MTGTLKGRADVLLGEQRIAHGRYMIDAPGDAEPVLGRLLVLEGCIDDASTPAFTLRLDDGRQCDCTVIFADAQLEIYEFDTVFRE